MNKQDSLSPIDFVVVLALAVEPQASKSTYALLGASLGLSASTTHESMHRLDRAGFIRPGTRDANIYVLRNFVAHAARHVFPPSVGKDLRGVPTAYAASAIQEEFDRRKPVVWPDASGTERGESLTPLYPKAVELPARNPRVYEALMLIDALRLGQARERNIAIKALDRMMGVESA